MDTLRELQLSELEILKWFDGFCRENRLQYYIVAGTLLGAVRHGGFIPWDDDVDVAMPRADFTRFEELIKESPDHRFFYQSHKTEPNYVFGFSKLRLNGTQVWEEYLRDVDIHKGAYIDIFPLDPCPEGRQGQLMFKGVEVISCAMMKKAGMDFRCGYTKKYMRALYHMACLLPMESLEALRQRIIDSYGKKSDGCLLATVHGAHGFPRETYRAEWMGQGSRLDFEGLKLTAPTDPDGALRNMYGDYMTPLENRDGHFNMEKTVV